MHARIAVNGSATRLSLSEVEVHGYPFNFSFRVFNKSTKFI